MTLRLLVSAVVLATVATSAAAQSMPGASAPAQIQPAPPLGGPVVAGVCLLSREAIFANAAAGKAASARLQELTRAAQGEIEQQRAPLEKEARTLESQRASLSADQFSQRSAALAQRYQTMQQQVAHASREIEATRAKVLEQISTAAQPVIAQAYRQKNCGLLLDRNTALGGNFANDLTAEVVRGLDARLQTISFERERLPQQSAAPARGGR